MISKRAGIVPTLHIAVFPVPRCAWHVRGAGGTGDVQFSKRQVFHPKIGLWVSFFKKWEQMYLRNISFFPILTSCKKLKKNEWSFESLA